MTIMNGAADFVRMRFPNTVTVRFRAMFSPFAVPLSARDGLSLQPPAASRRAPPGASASIRIRAVRARLIVGSLSGDPEHLERPEAIHAALSDTRLIGAGLRTRSLEGGSRGLVGAGTEAMH
jgi:hypothetical protein